MALCDSLRNRRTEGVRRGANTDVDGGWRGGSISRGNIRAVSTMRNSMFSSVVPRRKTKKRETISKAKWGIINTLWIPMGGETGEWEEAQMRYGEYNGELAKKLSMVSVFGNYGVNWANGGEINYGKKKGNGERKWEWLAGNGGRQRK